MPFTTRESAYTALANLLGNVNGVKSVTRNVVHWQDSPPESQPALYIQVLSEDRQNEGRRTPSRVFLNAKVWAYVQTNQGDPVGPLLNPLLDAIDDALAPPDSAGVYQTLGGVVSHCWVEGTTEIYEGTLGNTAVAVIPIKMLID